MATVHIGSHQAILNEIKNKKKLEKLENFFSPVCNFWKQVKYF